MLLDDAPLFGNRFEFMLENHVLPMLWTLESWVKEFEPPEIRSDRDLDLYAVACQHTAFHYNWGHVMVTTLVADSMADMARFCRSVKPSGLQAETGRLWQRTKSWDGKKSQQHCKAPPFVLGGEFWDSARAIHESTGLDATGFSGGTEFIEGMIRARNLIVHNSSLVKKVGKKFVECPIEDPPTGVVTDEKEPEESNEFAVRFPDYVSVDYIEVSPELFQKNLELVKQFLYWSQSQLTLLFEPPVTDQPQ